MLILLLQYNISATKYFANYLQTVELSFLDDLMSLRQPVDKSVWLNAPTAVNAYYDPQFNQFGKLVPFRGSFAVVYVLIILQYSWKAFSMFHSLMLDGQCKHCTEIILTYCYYVVTYHCSVTSNVC